MLFIYFISKASTKVALTLLGLEGRSCWALLDHPSSLSPRVCPEEPQTQSPFCLYTETINIKTSLQTLPRRSPFSSRPDRPPPSDLVSPSPRPAAPSQPRPRGGSWTTRATARVDDCHRQGPPPAAPHQLEARWSTSNTAQREGRGRAGAADEGGESLPTPAAPARPGAASSRPRGAHTSAPSLILGRRRPAELRGDGPRPDTSPSNTVATCGRAASLPNCWPARLMGNLRGSRSSPFEGRSLLRQLLEILATFPFPNLLRVNRPTGGEGGKEARRVLRSLPHQSNQGELQRVGGRGARGPGSADLGGGREMGWMEDTDFPGLFFFRLNVASCSIPNP